MRRPYGIYRLSPIPKSALRDRRRAPEADAGDGDSDPSTSNGAGSSSSALPSLAAGL